jgi:hypothetical protein
MSASKVTLGLLSAMGAVMAFQPTTTTNTVVTRSTSTSLQVAVDPTVVSKKDYEDICGVSFDSETLAQRLKRTDYLYPRHVEVVDDIAPIAGAMVDEIVSDVTLLDFHYSIIYCGSSASPHSSLRSCSSSIAA